MIGPRKAEVWQVDFGGARGHEQKKERPAIVWRDLSHLGLAIVIPFTSTLERANMPHTHVVSPNFRNGLETESVALIFQIVSIDKKRMVKRLGMLNEPDVNCVSALLKDLLRV